MTATASINTPRPPPLRRVYMEELKALPRGRFALAGAAALTAFLAIIAVSVSTTSSTGLWGFGIFAHLVLPSAFAAFAATQVSGARASRFVQPLFTTPLRKSTYLTAKVLVALTLGALYLLSTLPFYLIAHLQVGLSDYMVDFLLINAGLIPFGVALGTLLGVSFTGRSIGAPVSVALVIMVTCVFAGMFAATLLNEPEGTADTALRLTHLSPVVLLSDATDLYATQGIYADNPNLSLALFVFETVGLLALAYRVFLRHQGVEGWESGAGHRAGVAVSAALLLLAPVVAADVDYEQDTSEIEMVAPQSRDASLAIVGRGASISTAAFEFFAGTYNAPLAADERNVVDLLVAVPVGQGIALRNVTVRIEGQSGLQIEEGAMTRIERIDNPERANVRDFTSGNWQGAVIRVPVTLLPKDPEDLSMNIYGLNATVEYRVDGETTLRNGTAVSPLRADIPNAATQLALAGAPFPLVAAGAAVRRRARHG